MPALPALAAGSFIGPYQVLGELGAGAMGEVYRARDTRIGREVAVKVLPRELQDDAERLHRFRDEARAVGTLSHPNIITLYEVGEHEGAPYLVTELLEGQTLRARLADGALAHDGALGIALQVAHGLAAAHAKDIVHRDLKPANLFLARGGQVKLLDFGLARREAKGAAEAPQSTQTATGAVLGTVAYMAPEQVRGERVDARSDIFALGVILYEMVTGERPFAGGSDMELASAILRDEPPALQDRALDGLVRRCLAKAPRDRFQSAQDLAYAIEALAGGSLPSVWPRPRRRAWSLGAGIAVALAAAALVAGRSPLRQSDAPREPSLRLAIDLPAEAPLAPPGSMPLGNARPTLALSRDGRRLVYVALVGDHTQLYWRDMTTGEIQPIPGTQGAHTPFFSPDGEWVAFFADGTLKKVALATGETVVLADASNPAGGSWGDDDVIYFNPNEGAGLARTVARGGAVEPVNVGYLYSIWPEALPAGHGVLFSRMRGGIGRWRDDRVERLTSRGYFPRYVPTGHLLYVETGKLVAVPFDVERARITGAPVTMLVDLRTEIFGAAQLALSATGTLVYAAGEDTQLASLAWVDRHGKTEPLDLPRDYYGSFDISPDGSKLAVTIGEYSSSDIWLYDLARGGRARVTYSAETGAQTACYNPRWTPDGQHIVYACFLAHADAASETRLYWWPADGSREAVQLAADAPVLTVTSFAPDGSALALYSRAQATGLDIWVLPLAGFDPYSPAPRPKPKPFLQTPYLEAFPRFSPDGKWLAYMSDESGRREVYVRPYPGPGGKLQISTGGGTRPSWHPSGRELFYQRGRQWYAVDLSLAGEVKVGMPRLLFEGPFINVPGFSYAMAPDGERFLIPQNPEQFKPRTSLTVVTNFFDLLRRRAPPAKD